jgi:hypothetical protein
MQTKTVSYYDKLSSESNINDDINSSGKLV